VWIADRPSRGRFQLDRRSLGDAQSSPVRGTGEPHIPKESKLKQSTGIGSLFQAMLKGPSPEVAGDRDVAAMEAIHLSPVERCDCFGALHQDTVQVGEEEGLESFFGQL
jgi:hypothetical protein